MILSPNKQIDSLTNWTEWLITKIMKRFTEPSEWLTVLVSERKMKWFHENEMIESLTNWKEWLVYKTKWMVCLWSGVAESFLNQMEWFIHESELNSFLSQQLTNSLNIYHWTFASLFCKTYVSFYKW